VVYKIGAELRTGDKGDGVSSGPAIGAAVTQVSRSAGGWIERLVTENSACSETFRRWWFPSCSESLRGAEIQRAYRERKAEP
jgi:hypothetical protein